MPAVPPMDDNQAYPRELDAITLRLSIRAAGPEEAAALAARVAESLPAFVELTEVAEPVRFGHEASELFTLSYELRVAAPLVESRQKLLEFLGDGWETKIQVERVSDEEAEECTISEWIEASYKKKRRRFAFAGVWGATMLGPVTVYQAIDEDDDDSDY